MGGSFAYPFLRDHLSSSMFHELWLRLLTPSYTPESPEKYSTKVLDLSFLSSIGAESGLDINCIGLPKLLSMGLGFVELGPVTPVAEGSGLVAKTITSESITHLDIENTKGTMWLKRQLLFNPQGPRGVNIQAQKENILSVPNLTDDDFTYSIQELYSFTDFFTINLCISPFYQIKYYTKPQRYSMLLKKIIAARDIEIGLQVAKYMGSDINVPEVPRKLIPKLLVKVNKEWGNIEEFVKFCVEVGVDGIVIGDDDKDIARNLLEKAYYASNGKLLLVSYGGIDSGAEVLERVKRGAALIQIYAVLLQKGPWELKRIFQELSEELEKSGYTTLEDARGKFYSTRL